MNEKEYKTILYESGPVTKIVHNEPEKRNPLTGHFILELRDALVRFQRDREAVVGVLMSTGSVFCAGHNLGFVSKMDDWKPSEKKILEEKDWLGTPGEFPKAKGWRWSTGKSPSI